VVGIVNVIASTAYLDGLIEMYYLRSRINLDDVQKMLLQGKWIKQVATHRGAIDYDWFAAGRAAALIRDQRLRIAKCSSRLFMAVCEPTMTE
jgi:hypothetical protein